MIKSLEFGGVRTQSKLESGPRLNRRQPPGSRATAFILLSILIDNHESYCVRNAVSDLSNKHNVIVGTKASFFQHRLKISIVYSA